MLVKVNTSLAGHGFHYNFGAEVDSEEFSARVGNGWQNLCDPVAEEGELETAVVDQDSELAIFSPSVERAVVQKVVERRGRRK